MGINHFTFKKEYGGYAYRLFLKQWGIMFSFDVDILKQSQYLEKNRCQKVSDGLWIRLLDGSFEYKNDTLIELKNLEYNICHYQIESLTDAVLKWAELKLGVKIPETEVSFNKKRNKYEFSYSDVNDQQ